MAGIAREEIRQCSLLSTTNRVEAPFVRVVIGGYAFGVFENKKTVVNKSGIVTTTSDKYPNYIQNLEVTKINGTVNQYRLNIQYPITEDNDPNFFEKIFSTVSDSRKISFTYGDSLLPNYVFRDEEAIITNVTSKLNMEQAVISYTVEAVSASKLTLTGSYRFPSFYGKPSDEIKRILRNNGKYHLLDVYTGMAGDIDKFIASDDADVRVDTCVNVSVLEYISKLVSYMKPRTTSGESILKDNVYTLTTFEGTDGTGPYFKVQKLQKSSNSLNQLCTYEVDIGYPSSNIVRAFDIKNSENWSIYYKYSKEINQNDYLTRINSKGELEKVLSPSLQGTNFTVTASDADWWSKVTQYPVQATMIIKGLLRPVVLMQYIKVNMWYYGKKHISSGYYLINSQKDKIGLGGYETTLELIRVAPDTDIYTN